LRKGEPAPFFDHVNRRFNENRRLLSWCVSPSAPGYWRAGRLAGVSAREGDPSPFLRAVGVLYPGTPVQKLVKKSLLQEEGELVRWMEQAFDAEPLRAPSAASILPRPASNRVTVVTAMKNEGPFVLDWIAHNRVIGISDHLVYTNDCQDGTDRLLDALAEANVHRRDNPYRESGKVPQYAAFRAAESERAVQDTDWLLTLDVDEYMNIHTGDGRIGDLLAALPDAHVISVPWRMFGNADAHRFEDRPVTEIFTLCAPEFATRPLQAWAFKTLYRNAGLFRRLGVHRPKGLNTAYRGALSWVDACGKPLPPAVWQRAWRMSKAQWGYDLVTLNHYAVRSAESFLVKRERGKVNRTRREQGLAYWFRMNHNAETDTSIHRYAEATRREKAALLALPGVAEAHAEAVAWHEARIKTLLAESDYAELYAQITSPRMERLSRMATCFGANVHLVGPQVIPDEIAARDPSEPFFWTVKLTPEM
nr:glycosyltransferase family 2 protein [Paracoccaceae bacterium]